MQKTIPHRDCSEMVAISKYVSNIANIDTLIIDDRSESDTSPKMTAIISLRVLAVLYGSNLCLYYTVLGCHNDIVKSFLHVIHIHLHTCKFYVVLHPTKLIMLDGVELSELIGIC